MNHAEDMQTQQAQGSAAGEHCQKVVREQTKAVTPQSDHPSIVPGLQDAQASLLDQMHTEFQSTISEGETSAKL
jgi:hypothetical protein